MEGLSHPAYTDRMTETPTLERILSECHVLAVVGLSPLEHRPSHGVAHYMQAHGYRIVPVNPIMAQEGGFILGERCYATVQEAAQALAAQGQRIDMIDCFRKSEDIPPLADAAIEVGAKCLWLQLGVKHAQAEAKALQAGLWVVQDRCLKIEHDRLINRQ